VSAAFGRRQKRAVLATGAALENLIGFDG